jgi:hypothetical protein
MPVRYAEDRNVLVWFAERTAHGPPTGTEQVVARRDDDLFRWLGEGMMPHLDHPSRREDGGRSFAVPYLPCDVD